MIKTDHEFWTRYSARLTGDWLSYQTPIKELAAWAERVYLRRNFRNFTGDRKFIRDDQAQKSFSKLRSSIAGLYAWRAGNSLTWHSRAPAHAQGGRFRLPPGLCFLPL